MTKLRRLLPRLLLESFFVVLSVLVALAVNNWREGRERAAHADEARTAFANEIRANRDLLLNDDFLGHHRRLQAAYAKAAAAGAADPGALFERGLHPPGLRDAAWRSFSTSGILTDFAARDVLMLSDIYQAQADIDRRCADLLNGLSAPRADRETPAYQHDAARAFCMFLNDLVPAEERLVKSYERALQEFQHES
jgi:hypothetical protein